MITSIESFSARGFRSFGERYLHNEDVVVAGLRTFGAIDGARPPRDPYIDGVSAAAYFVRFLWRCLLEDEARSTAPDESVRVSLVDANRRWAAWVATTLPEIQALGREGPAASCALVRIHEDRSTYSWVQSGDCELFEVRLDGALEAIRGEVDTAAPNERARLALVRRYMKAGHPMHAIKDFPDYQLLMKELAEGRNVTRSTLNGDPEFARLVAGGERSLAGVAALVMITDGFFQPREDGEYDAADGAVRILERGAAAAYSELRALYDSDPEYRRFVRLKHIDDTSAIVVRFQ